MSPCRCGHGRHNHKTSANATRQQRRRGNKPSGNLPCQMCRCRNYTTTEQAPHAYTPTRAGKCDICGRDVRTPTHQRAQEAFERATGQMGDTTVTELTAATTKTCPKCKVEQPTTGFGKDKHRKDGLMNWCKGCMKAYWDAKRATQRSNRQVEPGAPLRERKPKPVQVVDEAKLDDIAFVATDEGQAALKAAADAADAARKAARNDAQRQRRAAAKAAAALGEQTI